MTADEPAEATPDGLPDGLRDELPDGLGELVLAIDHVGVAVADLDRAVQRWQRLGFVLTHTEENAEQGVREAMLRPAGAAPGTGAALQLLAPLTPGSAIARFLDRAGPGLQQLALTVGDVRAAADLLRDQGLRVLYPEPRTGTGGSLINFVHPADVGGVLLELVQVRPVARRVGPPEPASAAGTGYLESASE